MRRSAPVLTLLLLASCAGGSAVARARDASELSLTAADDIVTRWMVAESTRLQEDLPEGSPERDAGFARLAKIGQAWIAIVDEFDAAWDTYEAGIGAYEAALTAWRKARVFLEALGLEMPRGRP